MIKNLEKTDGERSDKKGAILALLLLAFLVINFIVASLYFISFAPPTFIMMGRTNKQTPMLLKALRATDRGTAKLLIVHKHPTIAPI